MNKYIITIIILSILAPIMISMVWLLDYPLASIYLRLSSTQMSHSEAELYIANILGTLLSIVSYMLIAFCLFKMYQSFKAGATSWRMLVFPSIISGVSIIFVLLTK